MARAQVDNDQANLKAAQAQVAGSSRRWSTRSRSRRRSRARLGIRQVDLGQYLAAGTSVVTLQALDPIYVDFTCRSRRCPRSRSGRR